MLGDALGDLGLVELRPVRVDGARGARERPRERQGVGGPAPGAIHVRMRDAEITSPTRSRRRMWRSANAATSSATRSSGARPRDPGPELDRGVDDEPHDVALLPLGLADEEATALRARLPRDPLEGVARRVVAQLA